MNKKLTINDFTFLKVVGKGSFGKVMQVKKNDDGKIYALKVLKKKELVKRKQVLFSHSLYIYPLFFYPLNFYRFCQCENACNYPSNISVSTISRICIGLM